MPTPRKGYFTKSGEKVPRTTTIIGRFKESGALINWAWKRGRDGLELYDSRDKAAEIGTDAHGRVERFLNGQDYSSLLTEANDIEASDSAFQAFMEWWEANKMTVLYQEIQIVSEIHKYGGTPDAIARDVQGRLVLLDWKTSSGVWPDHLVQLGAYRILWNETHPEMPLTGGSHIGRFAKEHGDFAHHYYPNLDKAEEQFLLFRRAYEIDKVLKKRA
jgi:hypothetical protein